MQTLEKVEIINGLISKLINFVLDNEDVRKELIQLQQNVIGEPETEVEAQAQVMQYVFDHKFNGMPVYKVFEERTDNLSQEEISILNNLPQSIDAVFEIKAVKKDCFDLFSIVNEKIYTSKPLKKMNNFRGIVPDQFLVGRILPIEGEYFIIDIKDILSSTAKEYLYRMTMMYQIQNPEEIYKDNSEKLVEIENIVKDLGVKFNEFFNNQNEIITSNEYADDLIGNFNDYFENNNPEHNQCPEELIKLPEKYAYFNIGEIANDISDPFDVATKSFSDYKIPYDVGVIFDEKLGLLVIPFYGTFMQIFKADDYKQIENYGDCIKNYLTSQSVAPSIIKKAYDSNPDRFKEIIKEVMDEEFSDIDELLKKYKQSYFDTAKFSTLTVLYASKAFNYVMEHLKMPDEIIPTDDEISKIGRNDPCYCGSGKKYKKCCINK